jgi:hypothetical protein
MAGPDACQREENNPRIGKMLAYGVIIQIIMTTATGKWGNLGSALESGRTQLVDMATQLYSGAVAASSDERSWRSELPPLPSTAEVLTFLWPRLVLFAYAAIAAAVLKLGIMVLRKGVPEEGFAFVKPPKDEEPKANATDRADGTAAKPKVRRSKKKD